MPRYWDPSQNLLGHLSEWRPIGRATHEGIARDIIKLMEGERPHILELTSSASRPPPYHYTHAQPINIMNPLTQILHSSISLAGVEAEVAAMARLLSWLSNNSNDHTSFTSFSLSQLNRYRWDKVTNFINRHSLCLTYNSDVPEPNMDHTSSGLIQAVIKFPHAHNQAWEQIRSDTILQERHAWHNPDSQEIQTIFKKYMRRYLSATIVEWSNTSRSPTELESTLHNIHELTPHIIAVAGNSRGNLSVQCRALLSPTE